MTKQSLSRDILGIVINTDGKWIEYQFTPEMNWSNGENDYGKPNYMFKISNDRKLKQAFCLKNTQPLLKEVHSRKGTKFNVLDYHL